MHGKLDVETRHLSRLKFYSTSVSLETESVFKYGITNCNFNAFYSVASKAEETIQVVAKEQGKKPDPRSLAQQFAKLRFSTSPPDDTLKETMERNEKAESWSFFFWNFITS